MMTLSIDASLQTLRQSVPLLGMFVSCLLVFGFEAFAVSPPAETENPSFVKKGTEEPHLRLQSGIVGLALHLTARRVGDPAQLIIRVVHPSGPAARAGITHGEEIFSVNGQSLTGQTYQETVSHIRGEIGSSVKLGLRGPQGERTLTLIRVNENILLEQTPQTM